MEAAAPVAVAAGGARFVGKELEQTPGGGACKLWRDPESGQHISPHDAATRLGVIGETGYRVVDIPFQFLVNFPGVFSHECCASAFVAGALETPDASCWQCRRLQIWLWTSVHLVRLARSDIVCAMLSPPAGGWRRDDVWRCDCPFGLHERSFLYCPVSGRARDRARIDSRPCPPTVDAVMGSVDAAFVESLVVTETGYAHNQRAHTATIGLDVSIPCHAQVLSSTTIAILRQIRESSVGPLAVSPRLRAWK